MTQANRLAGNPKHRTGFILSRVEGGKDIASRCPSALFSLLLAAFWLLASCATSQAGQPAATAGYRPDQFLILPKTATAPENLAKYHQRQGCRVLGELNCGRKLQVIQVPASTTVENLVQQYRASGLVDYAEPDYYRQLALTSPNDPKYLDGTLWALNNYGQNGGLAHADITAARAWDVQTSASNIIVAVLDTGIWYTHEDLAQNMWVNPVDGSHGTNSLAGTSDPKDDEGHGTLMAGVIGAVGNNGKGVVGVAWQVQLMACKCFSSTGQSSDSAIISAIDYARLNGARVINASFESTNFGVSLSNAIYRASQDGVLFVASCGNDHTNVDLSPRYPACFKIDNLVSVAYTTSTDSLGRYSNYGATNVHLAAPGAGVYSCFFGADNAYLGSPALEGTSYAAAYVSGALALLLVKYPNDAHQQTLVRLLNSTDPLPSLAGRCTTGGRLNLYSALAPQLRIVTLPATGPEPARFRVLSAPLQPCLVETSFDLKFWTPLLTNSTSLSGTFDFAAELSLGISPQFFRATPWP